MDWLDRFLAQEALPPAFRTTVDEVCRPLAALAADARAELGRTAVLGLCGAQGSGKTTIAKVVAHLLEDRGLNAVVLSLDDLYLGHAARADLAREVDALLAVRGPPGTHDVALGLRVLAGLGETGQTAMPRFDKGADDRRPREDWPSVRGPADVVVFEGWCVGARAQPPQDLSTPVNALERDEDPDGRWRGFVNAALAGVYPELFQQIDRFVLLAAPSFEVVAGWRGEQEAKLRARTGRGMAPDEIERFVSFYERLTRWILAEAPARADWVVRLDAERQPIGA
jgi:D-glycerate 3-kinase